MKVSKNFAAISAMTTSIVLLLVLQVFWLQSSYEKAFHDFRRETNAMFRSAVFVLRDSLFAKSIEPVNDSIFMATKVKGPEGTSVIGDSVINYVNLRDKGAKIQVFISSAGTLERDSIAGLLKPMTAKLQGVRGQRSFVFQLSPDSLSRDSIAGHFEKAMTAAGFDVPFIVKSSSIREVTLNGPRRFIGPPTDVIERLNAEEEKDTKFFSDTLATEFVRVSPMNKYSASLTGVRSFLLREISPQIIFSLILTLLTAGSFLIMYRSIRAQQKLVELKNDFISNVTHELKTPVATVSVAIEALQNFHVLDNPELTKEYLAIARNELNRLTLMTDKILKASAFENRAVDFSTEDINLTAIVSQVMESLKIVFEKQGARVSYTVDGDTSIKGSILHLTNVVYNLLDNALKYSKENPVLAIAINGTKDLVILSVQDNGIGIAPEYRKKIFEKFFRVPTGDIHNVKGYGLGLSYVASVVKSHGGTIEVTGGPHEGSCFTVALPRKDVLS